MINEIKYSGVISINFRMEQLKQGLNSSHPSKPKFDPHKKISLSTEAPPPTKDYDVTYDPKIGEFLKLPCVILFIYI